MNANELSKRLQHVGELVQPNSRLADIGSDHAYLPVALMLEGKIEYAVAGEVVEGPFQSAVKQVKKNGLSEKIIVRLGDGLEVIESSDRISCVTICGMGGTLIKEILERGKKHLSGSEHLILQPNIGERTLRKWLMENGYTVDTEIILEEKHKIYEIISAKRLEKAVNYSEEELLFGPKLVVEKNPVFRKKWLRELKQRELILENLKNSNQKDKAVLIQNEAALIKEVLT